MSSKTFIIAKGLEIGVSKDFCRFAGLGQAGLFMFRCFQEGRGKGIGKGRECLFSRRMKNLAKVVELHVSDQSHLGKTHERTEIGVCFFSFFFFRNETKRFLLAISLSVCGQILKNCLIPKRPLQRPFKNPFVSKRLLRRNFHCLSPPSHGKNVRTGLKSE